MPWLFTIHFFGTGLHGSSLWKDTLIFNVDPIDRPEVPCDVVSVNSVINTCNDQWRVAVDTWTRPIFSVDCCLLPCSPRYPYRFVKEKLWRKWFCFCGWYRFSGPTQLVTWDMIWRYLEPMCNNLAKKTSNSHLFFLCNPCWIQTFLCKC